jgi:hypothetical protein
MIASRPFVAACALGATFLSAATLAAPTSASDVTLRAKFTTTMRVFDRDRAPLGHSTVDTTPVFAALLRTDMIIRRAPISSDTASTPHGIAGKSLAVPGLNEIIAASNTLERQTNENILTVGPIFARHWSAGVKLFHAAGVQLGLYR